MAKKAAKQQTFAELLAELQGTAVQAKPVEVIEERKYFLIVCEGVRTEPIYFTYLQKFLPRHLLDTIEIIGEGDNTINVVKKAIEERDKRLKDQLKPAYDEVWAVYDKDDFPAQRFNEAVKMAAANGIESGHSNQAFELWYVLHFQYLDTALNRGDYVTILSKILGAPYVKNDEKVVAALFQRGDVPRAIEWAGKLKDMHTGRAAALAHPSTRVHLLVEKLLTYCRHESLKSKQTRNNHQGVGEAHVPAGSK